MLVITKKPEHAQVKTMALVQPYKTQSTQKVRAVSSVPNWSILLRGYVKGLTIAPKKGA